MIEVTLYGRGGQGGVTLAKLIATAFFNRGKNAQAFGVYAAERSGAPVQAYVRIDDGQITNHNQIREPDHVIVLDPTLIGRAILTGMKPDGWVILNTSKPRAVFSETFAGFLIATIDATSIAAKYGLGTRAVPIVNTTMMGAIARVFGLTFDEVVATFTDLGFSAANVKAAEEAYVTVTRDALDGVAERPPEMKLPATVGLFENSGDEPLIRTGAWATRRPESRKLTPPCNHRCPAGNDVQGFVSAIARGAQDEALKLLLETTPLPGICGRVCPAPCMEGCNRNGFDEGINVRDLERFAADHATWPVPHTHMRGERVAVVGSGPAGLSAAYQLARFGYHVSLFEANDELGGVLRNGIPEYRLPREVLDREIGFILMHGVVAYTDAKIDRPGMAELAQRYDAVFVATGLQHAQSLNLGDAAGIVVQGIEFLDRVHRFEESLRGQRVAVIGGGNTAIDAARSARRLGAGSVHLIYRRTVGEMPAIPEEICAAIEEGIVLQQLAAPLRLDDRKLVCGRMKLGDETDASGRPKPVPTGEEFTVDVDRVVLALGQSADHSLLVENESVFIGGDFAANEGTVASAIGSGRRAAFRIHHLLSREDLVPSDAVSVATPDLIRERAFEHDHRRTGEIVPAIQRARSFTEVHRGLRSDDALAEAKRCMSCGVCNACDRCVTYCPEGILRRNGDTFEFHYDYCKGCGLCAAECPRGAIAMAEL
jgi:2-oxoacid:acceptor oxidoreductase gamma subunit (pyruvate/2-ketoisovalerate family)